MARTPRQAVELFHLAFLAELGAKLDRALYAVKGGANLRFFFSSVRYSEDLDIDVEKAELVTLRQKVDRILSSRSLALTLGAQGIAITSTSRPKQTETTQRWRLGLTVDATPVHTKIEFSRRGRDPGIEFGSVDRALLGSYGLSSVLVSHYGRQAAFEQKVRALVGRSETQARDVFDLQLLLAGPGSIAASALDTALRQKAIERALALDFGAFRSQVLAYLLPERQREYDSSDVWEQMVLELVQALEGPEPA